MPVPGVLGKFIISSSLSFIVEEGRFNNDAITLITGEWNKPMDPKKKKQFVPEKHRLQQIIDHHDATLYEVDQAKRELIAEMNKYYQCSINPLSIGDPIKSPEELEAMEIAAAEKLQAKVDAKAKKAAETKKPVEKEAKAEKFGIPTSNSGYGDIVSFCKEHGIKPKDRSRAGLLAAIEAEYKD